MGGKNLQVCRSESLITFLSKYLTNLQINSSKKGWIVELKFLAGVNLEANIYLVVCLKEKTFLGCH